MTTKIILSIGADNKTKKIDEKYMGMEEDIL